MAEAHKGGKFCYVQSELVLLTVEFFGLRSLYQMHFPIVSTIALIARKNLQL